MEFQVSAATAERFAAATATYIRARADLVQELSEQEAWHTLWVTFRDADNTTLTVPYDSARLMHRVWGNRHVWESPALRQTVKAEMRPQWRRQMINT